MNNIEEFIRESNKIENIHRNPTQEEISEFKRFIALDSVSIEDLERFVKIYEPTAYLRDSYSHCNVRVGSYYPPFSGPQIRSDLIKILNCEKSPFSLHVEYEKLHPFSDCNGRSGRALWAWKMKQFPLGFLHHFYYQTLGGFYESQEDYFCKKS
jgi:hypothetical protein